MEAEKTASPEVTEKNPTTLFGAEKPAPAPEAKPKSEAKPEPKPEPVSEEDEEDIDRPEVPGLKTIHLCLAVEQACRFAKSATNFLNFLEDAESEAGILVSNALEDAVMADAKSLSRAIATYRKD